MVYVDVVLGLFDGFGGVGVDVLGGCVEMR